LNESEKSGGAREMKKEGMGKDSRFGTVNFERRKHPRFSLNLPVEYWPADESKSHPSRAGNVSEGGMLLYCPEEIEIGKNLRLRLFIDSGLDFFAIDAFAEVVWADLPFGDEGEHRIGLKFNDISEKDVAHLKTFLNSLMDLRIKPKLDILPRLLSALEIKTSELPFRSPPKR
jgi:hypothetical protein